MKKLLTLTLVFLTSLVFSQTFSCTTSPYQTASTTHTVVVTIPTSVPQGTQSLSFNYLSVGSTQTFTILVNEVSVFTNTLSQTFGFTAVMSPTFTFTTSTINTLTILLSSTSSVFCVTDASATAINGDSQLTLSTVSGTTTGIKNVEATNLPLDMYTNLNTLFIKNNDNVDGVKLEVFNLAGQLVFEENTVDKNTYELNVATGIYIVRLSKEDNFKTKKVFIGQ